MLSSNAMLERMVRAMSSIIRHASHSRSNSKHGCMCFFSPRTFFRQAAVKQGETRDQSLRARRPTGVGQDIALQRRAGVRVANVGGELAEARSERSLRCDCEHLPPPAPVRGCDRRALRRGAGESSALRDAVEEGLSLLAPSPSNFEGQHRQTTPPGSLKLRVGYPMLALGSGSQGEAGLVVGARSAAPVSPQRADERHINRYLHASKGRESMRDDLEPAPVGQWQAEVQVAEEDVGRDPSSRLPADARRCALQGASAADQHTGCGAGCPVVSELVEGAAAAAGSGFKWQWEAQAPQEHAAEGVILQRELLARWQRREREAAAWPSLGEQQSPRRSVKVRKERLKGPLIQAGTSCLLPSPCRVAEMARLTGGEPVREGRPRRRVESR